MQKTKDKLDQIKQAIINTSKTSFDIEQIYDELSLWLSQFKFPNYPNASTWEDCIETFPPPEGNYIRPTEGLKLRILLKLFTAEHKYIISIIECFNHDAVGIGILCVHVNMDEVEYNMQKTIEMTYKRNFDNTLTAKQTLFIESFNIQSFLTSMNNAGIAILGNELLGENKKKDVAVLKKLTPQAFTFPEHNE